MENFPPSAHVHYCDHHRLIREMIKSGDQLPRVMSKLQVVVVFVIVRACRLLYNTRHVGKTSKHWHIYYSEERERWRDRELLQRDLEFLFNWNRVSVVLAPYDRVEELELNNKSYYIMVNQRKQLSCHHDIRKVDSRGKFL